MAYVLDQVEADNDMPRHAARSLGLKEIDSHLESLRRCASDTAAFQLALDRLSSDREVSASDMIELARRFTGSAAKSRKAALQAIGQEHLRLAHQRAKGASATKARVW